MSTQTQSSSQACGLNFFCLPGCLLLLMKQQAFSDSRILGDTAPVQSHFLSAAQALSGPWGSLHAWSSHVHSPWAQVSKGNILKELFHSLLGGQVGLKQATLYTCSFLVPSVGERTRKPHCQPVGDNFNGLKFPLAKLDPVHQKT